MIKDVMKFTLHNTETSNVFSTFNISQIFKMTFYGMQIHEQVLGVLRLISYI